MHFRERWQNREVRDTNSSVRVLALSLTPRALGGPPLPWFPLPSDGGCFPIYLKPGNQRVQRSPGHTDTGSREFLLGLLAAVLLPLEAEHPHSGQKGTAYGQTVNPPHRAFPGASPGHDAVQPFATTESHGHPYTERHWEKQASTRKETRDRELRRKPAVSAQGGSQDGPQAQRSTRLPRGRHLGGRCSSEQTLPLLRLLKKPLGTQDTRAPLPHIILPKWR